MSAAPGKLLLGGDSIFLQGKIRGITISCISENLGKTFMASKLCNLDILGGTDSSRLDRGRQ